GPDRRASDADGVRKPGRCRAIVALELADDALEGGHRVRRVLPGGGGRDAQQSGADGLDDHAPGRRRILTAVSRPVARASKRETTSLNPTSPSMKSSSSGGVVETHSAVSRKWRRR